MSWYYCTCTVHEVLMSNLIWSSIQMFRQKIIRKRSLWVKRWEYLWNVQSLLRGDNTPWSISFLSVKFCGSLPEANSPGCVRITYMFWVTTKGGCIYPVFGFRFPMFQPQRRKVLTTFGVTAAVRGTRKKIRLLCTAYAKASWVQIPRRKREWNISQQECLLVPHWDGVGER